MLPIDTAEVCSCDDLKEVIKRQLHRDITAIDFDVGYACAWVKCGKDWEQKIILKSGLTGGT